MYVLGVYVLGEYVLGVYVCIKSACMCCECMTHENGVLSLSIAFTYLTCVRVVFQRTQLH